MKPTEAADKWLKAILKLLIAGLSKAILLDLH